MPSGYSGDTQWWLGRRIQDSNLGIPAQKRIPIPLRRRLAHRSWISSSFIVEILQFLSRHIRMNRGGSVRSYLFNLESVRLEIKPLDPANKLRWIPT
jgi:hypothetical protein